MLLDKQGLQEQASGESVTSPHPSPDIEVQVRKVDSASKPVGRRRS